MEDPNDKMENFFRNALDKMDAEPSDQVWLNLNERLDQEKPKGLWLNWLKYLIPLALLISCFSVLHYRQGDMLEDYRVQLTELTEENERLSSSLDQQVNPLSDNNLQNQLSSSETRTIEKIKYRTKIERDTIYIYKSSFDRRRFSDAESLAAYEEGYVAGQNQPSALITATAQKEQKTSKKQAKLVAPSYLPHISFPLIDHTVNGTAKASISRMSFAALHNPKRKRKKYKYKGPLIVNRSDTWGQPNFYYKIGLGATVLSTLKGDLFGSSSIGFGYGIVQELGLTTRFAIQAGAYRSTQEYSISNNGAPIDNRDISSYPEQINLESQIISIEVDNDFYDFPVGIKYDFYQDNLKSFFLNPAVKWSVHSPQRFSYMLTDNRLSSYSSDRRFGYLNALSLAVGTDKNISPSLCYQLSVGYELGIEPVGIERQHLHSVHMKFSLLYGKK